MSGELKGISSNPVEVFPVAPGYVAHYDTPAGADGRKGAYTLPVVALIRTSPDQDPEAAVINHRGLLVSVRDPSHRGTLFAVLASG